MVSRVRRSGMLSSWRTVSLRPGGRRITLSARSAPGRTNFDVVARTGGAAAPELSVQDATGCNDGAILPDHITPRHYERVSCVPHAATHGAAPQSAALGSRRSTLRVLQKDERGGAGHHLEREQADRSITPQRGRRPASRCCAAVEANEESASRTAGTSRSAVRCRSQQEVSVSNDKLSPRPAAHQCPNCQYPQTKIKRVLSEGKFGATSFVCSRIECALGIDVSKLHTWVSD